MTEFHLKGLYDKQISADWSDSSVFRFPIYANSKNLPCDPLYFIQGIIYDHWMIYKVSQMSMVDNHKSPDSKMLDTWYTM